ncbi:MAG: hypothetical protein OJF47_000858 [Nitrospira sp.]|jgi:hypothetical protein|nr:MAG: hypothetical protein OJF47_000858 [Nitrospira sp.]
MYSQQTAVNARGRRHDGGRRPQVLGAKIRTSFLQSDRTSGARRVCTSC